MKEDRNLLAPGNQCHAKCTLPLKGILCHYIDTDGWRQNGGKPPRDEDAATFGPWQVHFSHLLPFGMHFFFAKI